MDYDDLAAHPQPTPKETLMQVQLLKLPALPKLAWLCIVDKQSGAAIVQHGSAVETSDGFAIEGVWDDDFNGGGLTPQRYSSVAVSDGRTAQ